MKTTLIAPCGMNCGICMAFLREKNRCISCRVVNKNNSITRYRCIIRTCRLLKKNEWRFCSSKCQKYPCKRLKSLDKRYRTKYNMSMIENLEFIKKHGIRKFVKSQKKKYKCLKCNGMICVHNRKCYDCGNVLELK